MSVETEPAAPGQSVLRTAYQQSVAAYWDAKRDQVNLRLGEVDGDLTRATIPYWELRAGSSVATGIEDAFLAAYREGSFHYQLIVADYVGR